MILKVMKSRSLSAVLAFTLLLVVFAVPACGGGEAPPISEDGDGSATSPRPPG